MEHPEEYYYKLNLFLLSASGLSPYQSKRSALLIRAALTVIMVANIFLMFKGLFIASEITMDFMVDWIPTTIVVGGGLTNLYTRVINIDKFRELFERISKDWALQKTHDETKIMHEHAEASRLFTLCYLSFCYIVIGTYIIWMFVPEILDIMSPMNESRPRRRPIDIQFLEDEERYFYLLRLEMCLMLLITPIIYVGCTSLFLTLTIHVCGMCELLGNRAERLFCVIEEKVACDLIQGSQISYGGIAVFVRQHYNVIQFVEIIETCHTLHFLMDLIGIVILMSLTLIQISSVSSFERAVRSFSVSIGGLCYIFMSCYMGQRITDLSSKICERIFNFAWYNAIVSEQKALLIIMMRHSHPVILTACKFYVMSLPNFGMILQTAISYFMFARQF